VEMTSYERVKAALEHKEPDRVPFDLGGALVCGININALRSLKRYLDMPGPVELWEPVTQLGRIGDDLVERLRIDVINVSPNPPSRPGLARDLGNQDGFHRLIDEFGIGWQMPLEGGFYHDLYLNPLRDAETVQDIDRYPWPDPLDLARFVGMKERAAQVVKIQKKACFLERMVSGMWEQAMWMTGYEKFFTDMLTNEKLVHAIMEKLLEINMKYWGNVLQTVSENVLIVSMADDLGAQTSLLVSLGLYQRLIYPYHKRLFEFIKKTSRGKAYIFFHNDGAIYETIPLLIEAGVDILNPFQVSCTGMDTRKFKQEFGKDLTIWGGSCDTQDVLPFGTPEEVRAETKRRIDDLAPGGGFIFAPIHIIQGGVPPENSMAWWETLQEYGVYS
jgi:uroporphyrinogen decarboxylase